MINLKATKMLGGVETEIQLEGAPFDVVDEMSLSLVHIINMMTKDDYQHFVCIVAGSNPEELMKQYDETNEE